MLQATVSEGLAQGPYVAAGVGFESVTLQTQGTELKLSHHAPQSMHVIMVINIIINH